MRRLRSETSLGEAMEDTLRSLEESVHILVMAEDWCPDVVRHVPALQRIVDTTPMVRVRYVLRKSNPDLLVRFLPNGTESVPKFGFFNKDFAFCGQWGRRVRASPFLVGDSRAIVEKRKDI
ncbi:MAG: thioredoxin family protein, partial [Candidatus Hydrogenedentes bacterium]|nr:thioredoxin family protein [Candidatus Hydrogenedentota bacterium]